MLEREKYRFEYDDIDWTQIKEAFPVKSVLEDYMGVSVKGNRCACPIHGGKKLSMQVFDTTAKCYSECQESFSAFDLVKHNDNLSSTYDAILHLCDFYNIDPLSFDGIKPANGNDNTKRTPTRKNPIPLSKAQLDFMNLKVNPFTRHTVQIKTGEKTHTNARGQIVTTPILSKQYLSDQECAWIMMQGVKNLAKNGNKILYNTRQYLYTIQMKTTDGLFLVEILKKGLSWYEDALSKINTIGVKEPINKEEVLAQYFNDADSFYTDYPDTNAPSIDKIAIASTKHLMPDHKLSDTNLHLIEHLQSRNIASNEAIESFLYRMGINDTLPSKGTIMDEYERPMTMFADKDEYLLNAKERLIRHELQTDWVLNALNRLESISVNNDYQKEAMASFRNILLQQKDLASNLKDIITQERSNDYTQEQPQEEREEEIER